jgi:hypothetical protein
MDPKLVPEMGRGVALIKECTRTFLYDLSPYGSASTSKGQFTTALLRLVTFGFTFDRPAITSYVHDTSLITNLNSRPVGLMRDVGTVKRYVVYDLVDFFKSSAPWSLDNGIIFLKWVLSSGIGQAVLTSKHRHIVATKIQVDIGTLSSYAERLCSSTIFARRLAYQRPTFHDLVMPKSWFVFRLEDLEFLSNKHTQLWILFVEAVGEILTQVHGGTARMFHRHYFFTNGFTPMTVALVHLTYRGKPISDVNARVKNVVVARMYVHSSPSCCSALTMYPPEGAVACACVRIFKPFVYVFGVT